MLDTQMSKIEVLDKGYVKLVTYTPWNMVAIQEALDQDNLNAAKELLKEHDLSEVNAARASFAKEKTSLNAKDTNLIDFLAEAKPVPHTSPFRHSYVTLEVYCPLVVARQWWRHVIGAGTTEEGTPWSELSRRYVRGGVDYHLPTQFRYAAANAKQGSGKDLETSLNDFSISIFSDACAHSVEAYERLLEHGIAAEQARMVLPQGVFTSFRWSPSILAVSNFLTLRLAPDTQLETRVYAEAVYNLVKPIYPLAFNALVKED